jgi:hypothetical protein
VLLASWERAGLDIRFLRPDLATPTGTSCIAVPNAITGRQDLSRANAIANDLREAVSLIRTYD